ncbi:hypothetical protein [Herbaspirillum huttiense]|uniref:hypothetical protein n=1 Tax=Herbaspirillum huttiense TaxID=863372 RepID=UPI0039B07A46
MTSAYSKAIWPSTHEKSVVTISHPITVGGRTFPAPQLIIVVNNEKLSALEADFGIFQKLEKLKQAAFLEKLRALPRYEGQLLTTADLPEGIETPTAQISLF